MNYDQAIEALAKSSIDIEQIITDLKITKANKCAFCANHSEYLCDHAFGWSNWEYSQFLDVRLRTNKSEPLTCDAPLCSKCRTITGRIFDLCGPGSFDTKDVCPVHQDHIDGDFTSPIELTMGGAESLRLRYWKFKYFQRKLMVDN